MVKGRRLTERNASTPDEKIRQGGNKACKKREEGVKTASDFIVLGAIKWEEEKSLTETTNPRKKQ